MPCPNALTCTRRRMVRARPAACNDGKHSVSGVSRYLIASMGAIHGCSTDAAWDRHGASLTRLAAHPARAWTYTCRQEWQRAHIRTRTHGLVSHWRVDGCVGRVWHLHRPCSLPQPLCGKQKLSLLPLRGCCKQGAPGKPPHQPTILMPALIPLITTPNGLMACGDGSI